MLVKAGQVLAQIVTGCIDSLQRGRAGWSALAAAMVLGCSAPPTCDHCDTLVVAATGEPRTLVPPLVSETVGRDISDLVFERLAVLRTGAASVDTTGFEPALAERWQRVDSLTWRFTLRRNAVWADGRPVTADDVVFSFASAVDTALGAPNAGALGSAVVTADQAGRISIRFPRPSPEQLFDATYHVRIIPKHIFDPLPRSAWDADTGVGRLVGSGPYRVAEWHRGQSLTLERTGGTIPFRRIIWRFADEQDAALNLVLSGAADIVETAAGPDARQRARNQPTVSLIPYPAAVYGFLNFRHASHTGVAHPVLGDRAVRQALAHAIDRPTLIGAVVGADAAVPPGPMSRALWIWNDSIPAPSFNVARARQLLDSAGWRPGPGGIRSKAGRRLALEILVPSTSGVRRGLAEGIQQMWKQVGADATIAPVDFPIFQARSGSGQFDALIGAWLDEPSPRGLADQWTRAGFEILNQGRYSNPAFDSLLAAALAAPTPTLSQPIWNRTIATLNDDAAAVFLYNPTNVAVASRRLREVTIDPFSWLHDIGRWRKVSHEDSARR